MLRMLFLQHHRVAWWINIFWRRSRFVTSCNNPLPIKVENMKQVTIICVLVRRATEKRKQSRWLKQWNKEKIKWRGSMRRIKSQQWRRMCKPKSACWSSPRAQLFIISPSLNFIITDCFNQGVVYYETIEGNYNFQGSSFHQHLWSGIYVWTESIRVKIFDQKVSSNITKSLPQLFFMYVQLAVHNFLSLILLHCAKFLLLLCNIYFIFFIH